MTRDPLQWQIADVAETLGEGDELLLAVMGEDRFVLTEKGREMLREAQQ